MNINNTSSRLSFLISSINALVLITTNRLVEPAALKKLQLRLSSMIAQFTEETNEQHTNS